MDKYRITSLARPLDTDDTGNLLIIRVTLIVFLVSTAYHYILGDMNSSILFENIKASMTVFLTWVVARELDPDHSFSAFVPVTLVLYAVFFQGVTPVLPVLWVIMILRTINRSTGIKAGVLDIMIMLSLGILLTFKASWIYGILTGLGLMVDSRLPPPERLHFIAGVFITVVSLLFLVSGNVVLEAPSFSDYPTLIAIAVLFLPVILGSSEIQSVGDRTLEELDPTRVRAAQLMTVIIVFSLSLGGVNSWLYLMYCILAGIGIYWIFSGKVKAA